MNDDWNTAISMRLAALALDQGRLTDDLITAMAVRGTLLVDLALRGRIVETTEAVHFDPRPTGFPPADRLIADGAPSLSDLLHRGVVDQEDLAAEHLRRGSWTLRRRWFGRRYVDHQADRTHADERAMTASPDRQWAPADAALTAIGSTLGLLATPRALPTEQLLTQTGPVRWLVELIVAEVNQSIVRGRSMQGAVTWADR